MEVPNDLEYLFEGNSFYVVSNTSHFYQTNSQKSTVLKYLI